MNLRQQLVFCQHHIRGIEQAAEDLSCLQQQLVELLNSEEVCDKKLRPHRTIFILAALLGVLLIGWVFLLISYGEVDGIAECAGLIPPAIPLVIALVVCGKGWSRHTKELHHLRKNNPIRKQQIESDIVQLRKHAQTLIDTAAEEGVFQIVPMDYTSSEMLQYCISVVDRKLANTLQEAFLLLEQELQRQEQIARQQHYYDSQAEQMERLTNAVHVNTMVNMLNNESHHY